MKISVTRDKCTICGRNCDVAKPEGVEVAICQECATAATTAIRESSAGYKFKAIWQRRTSKGYSQEDMAAKLHSTPSTYRRLEKGELKTVKLTVLKAVCEILEMDLSTDVIY